jgi:hypothetical protein
MSIFTSLYVPKPINRATANGIAWGNNSSSKKSKSFTASKVTRMVKCIICGAQLNTKNQVRHNSKVHRFPTPKNANH